MMIVPPAPSSVCPLLIGRTARLQSLVRLVERAAAGLGNTALVAGEAGIGKSRLLARDDQLNTEGIGVNLPVPGPPPEAVYESLPARPIFLARRGADVTLCKATCVSQF
jgi:hypothetical protein